jgi:hypothetical protein
VFDRLVRAAMRRGFQRGMGEGSGPWLAIGVAAVGVRVLRRLARPSSGTVYREELRPGETLVITHSPAQP